jgi:replicative DNA helicase
MADAFSNDKNKVSDAYSGKLPPQALDAERYLLGALLQDNDAVVEHITSLRADDFYTDQHRHIFKAIYDLHESNQPVDMATLLEKLKSSTSLEAAGGRAYIFELIETTASAANVAYHIELIREKSLLRQLIHSSNEIIRDALDPSNSAEAVVEKAEQSMYAITEEHTQGTMRTMQDLLAETMKIIENYKGNELTGFGTGFEELDDLTSGLQPTDFIVLAGRPGSGKTAFALSLLAKSSIHYGTRALYFSLEMGAEQLTQRILCNLAQINMQNLRRGKLSRQDYAKIPIAAAPLSKAPIYIDDQPALTIVELKSKCRVAQKRYGIDMVIVDYLQLMNGGKGSENRQNEISQISRGLKQLAKELHIPVIALSQLSRKVEEPGRKGRPQLSDLRESGAIEQDADMVWFIYRPAMYDHHDSESSSDPTLAQLLVAKHRNGPVKDINLTFIAENASFHNFSGMVEQPHSNNEDF